MSQKLPDQFEFTTLEKLLGSDQLTIKDIIFLRNIDKTENNLNLTDEKKNQFYRTGFQIVFGTVSAYSILALYSLRLYINYFSNKFETETKTLTQTLNNEERYKISMQRTSQLEMMISRTKRLRFPLFLFGGMVGFSHGLNIALVALKANSKVYVSEEITKTFHLNEKKIQ